jgi:YrbI family 3-deoxy-D-manno-octulosonate 8-phosphate phosphatase
MIKLLILDVDGVLTDGNKIYDVEHNAVYKKFNDRDFTAIKRFTAAGVKVVFISGDNFNRNMTEKRNEDLSLDKSRYLKEFEKSYKISIENMAFIGDDYFDLSIIKGVNYSFCPSNSPEIVKNNCFHTLERKSGDGVIVELYDLLVGKHFEEPSEEEVNNLDKKELASQEMS